MREKGKEEECLVCVVIVYVCVCVFLQREERTGFLVWSGSFQLLRAEESGGFKTWVSGFRGTICKA